MSSRRGQRRTGRAGHSLRPCRGRLATWYRGGPGGRRVARRRRGRSARHKVCGTPERFEPIARLGQPSATRDV